MYSGIGINAEPKKEIRIELQIVTGFYSMMRTILLRLWMRNGGKSGGGAMHGDFRDSAEDVRSIYGEHTFCRRGDFTTSCFHFTATSGNTTGG